MILLLYLAFWVPLVACDCRCIPSNSSCWPSIREWNNFNRSISGKLIKTVPPATPCYPGPLQNEAQCNQVNQLWPTEQFQASQPIGYDFPLNNSCPPITFSTNTTGKTCTLGNSPVYAVNVTKDEDIVKSINYAKKHNLRVTIKSSGHDFLERSTGYGSLLIWLHHFRRGFTFHDNYNQANSCPNSSWNGSALTITGSYTWGDLYPAAAERGLILVGGDNDGPSVIGGFIQGGGHGPLTQLYGLAAEHVLSLRVVLASGDIVTASPCSFPELFSALKGGGGGTYGIVTQMTIKTYPTTNVERINFSIGSMSENVSHFLDAVSDMYSSFPYLSSVGFAGYFKWGVNMTRFPLVEGYPTALSGYVLLYSSNRSEATRLFAPVATKFLPLNGTLLKVAISQQSFSDYAAYYNAGTGTSYVVGRVGAINSWLMGESALTGNVTLLRETLDLVRGAPQKPVFHDIVLHGMQSRRDFDPFSKFNPGWRDSVIMEIFSLPLSGNKTADAAVYSEINDVLTPAYRRLSPGTGAYANEAFFLESEYEEDFFGTNWEELSDIKATYDPNGVFYCPTCVGSNLWQERSDGALCKV